MHVPLMNLGPSTPTVALAALLALACSDPEPPLDAGPPRDAGVSLDSAVSRDAAVNDAALDAGPDDGGTDAALVVDAGGPFTPYFEDNFESYADGDRLSGGRPFGEAGRTRASSEQSFRGDRSARMEILSGDGGGFGRWGAGLRITPALGVGEEIWVSLRVYWPSAFVFSASPWMKFLRLHNRRGDGSNGGYNDLYIDNADSTMSVLRTIKEVDDRWAVYDGPAIQRDTWEQYEMYLYIDDQPVDSGGRARVRIWRDQELIFDREDVPTVTGPDGTIDLFYLFTYWNNESPPDNYCFVDDLVIATSASPPPGRDAAGNPFIGDYAP